MAHARTILVWLGCGVLGGCVGAGADGTAVAQRESAIYHGNVAPGYESTVRVRRWIESFNFGSCSGTVVAPRVVITARHCISDVGPSDVAVETGREGELGQFAVAEIRTTEGTLVTDNDFAVLVMQDRVDAPAVPWAASFDAAVGTPITLVGYGKTDEAVLQIGIKHVGEAEVESATALYFVTRGEQNGCFGDSGGTGLDPDGVLVGVITHVLYGPDPDDVCEGGRTGLNRIDPYADMIAQAIDDAFVCEEREVCGDEVDDDCDGRADDGCTNLGQECADDVQCTTGDCRAFGGAAVCTQVCTPGAFPDECPQPLDCEALADGTGACLEDPVPPLPVDAGADGGGEDAGTEGAAPEGCGCRIAALRAGHGGAALLVAVVAGVRAFGRRRRRRAAGDVRSDPF